MHRFTSSGYECNITALFAILLPVWKCLNFHEVGDLGYILMYGFLYSEREKDYNRSSRLNRSNCLSCSNRLSRPFALHLDYDLNHILPSANNLSFKQKKQTKVSRCGQVIFYGRI